MTERRPSAAAIARAAAVLRRGGVVAFPTDTVYGVGASVFRPAAMRRLYRLKRRDRSKPLAVLVENAAAAGALTRDVPIQAKTLMDRFWPGPLTLILPASPLGTLVTGGRATIGVRVPRGPVVRALLRACGAPLAATSANASGKPAAVSAAAVRRQLGTSVDLVLDGGRTTLAEESTVIDASRFPFLLLRAGAGAEAIKAVVLRTNSRVPIRVLSVVGSGTAAPSRRRRLL